MTTLYRYLVPCLTENARITTDYRETVPTTCPNNNTHVIDPTGIVLFTKLTTKTVSITESTRGPIGDYFRVDQYAITITGGTGNITTYDIVYPYNIAVFSTTIYATDSNIGDLYSFLIVPNQSAGTIAAPIINGATGLVLITNQAINPGFNISINDGINSDDLGYITSINTNTINYSTPVTHDYSTSANVYLTIPKINNGKFVNTQNIKYELPIIGFYDLFAGYIIRIIYTNQTTDVKSFNFSIELKY